MLFVIIVVLTFHYFCYYFLLIAFYSISFSDTVYELASGPTYILIIPSGRGKK